MTRVLTKTSRHKNTWSTFRCQMRRRGKARCSEDGITRERHLYP